MKIKHLTLRSSLGIQTGWRGEGDLLHWGEEYYQWATLVRRTDRAYWCQGSEVNGGERRLQKKSLWKHNWSNARAALHTDTQQPLYWLPAASEMMFPINWPLGLNNTLDFASPFGTSERWKVVCFEWRRWQNICGAATLLFSFHLFEQVKRKTLNKWNMQTCFGKKN